MASAGVAQAAALNGVTRTFYIAADEIVWDYAPTDMNQITGKPFGEEENLWVQSGPHRIGKVYKKAIYREYTDSTFTELKPRPSQWPGIGRPIRETIPPSPTASAQTTTRSTLDCDE